MSADNWVDDWFTFVASFSQPSKTGPGHDHMELWICRRCGSTVEYAALPLHRKWHQGLFSSMRTRVGR